MARPNRNDVDYFPLYCKEGKTMHFIRKKFGNDGYVVWIRTLRALAIKKPPNSRNNLISFLANMFICVSILKSTVETTVQ